MANKEGLLAQILLGAGDVSQSQDVDNTAVPGVLLLASHPVLERRITDLTIHNTDAAAAATIAFYDQNGNRKYIIKLAADETAVVTLKSAIVWRKDEDIYGRTSSASVAEVTISGKEGIHWP